ncbi:MAG: hypothetical protein Ct9H90mP9_5430 [Pseudomonadota bacterium]|nr:MAG: hypothetical protein Ct9H90mP9_5430 [Pseudomonadota bacterium]
MGKLHWSNPLTGVDADRFEEEKQRGITIALWALLPMKMNREQGLDL